jgi:hypothetical protein
VIEEYDVAAAVVFCIRQGVLLPGRSSSSMGLSRRQLYVTTPLPARIVDLQMPPHSRRLSGSRQSEHLHHPTSQDRRAELTSLRQRRRSSQPFPNTIDCVDCSSPPIPGQLIRDRSSDQSLEPRRRLDCWFVHQVVREDDQVAAWGCPSGAWQATVGCGPRVPQASRKSWSFELLRWVGNSGFRVGVLLVRSFACSIPRRRSGGFRRR